MNNAIKSCLTARVPVLVWGEPGAGKTSSIRAMAVEMNKPIWTVIASYREPADFGGLPAGNSADARRRLGRLSPG